MNRCPNCSYENLPTNTFCGRCGNSLASVSSSLEPTYYSSTNIAPPPPPPRTSPRQARKPTGKSAGPLLYIILGVLVILLCCTGGYLVVRNAVSSSAPTQANQIGYAVDASPWQVLVNTVTETTQGDFAPPPGQTYLVATIELTNTSSDVQHTSSLLQWSLHGSNNVAYDQSISANVQTPDGTVAAGASVNGQIAYQVPLDLHTFTLTFEPDPGSNTLITWNIKV